MKQLLKMMVVLLAGFSAAFGQQHDSIYHVQDGKLIPTRSGIGVYSIIVRKKTHTTPLPVVLFYTTYHQGPRDAFFAKKSADRDYVGIVVYARGIQTNLNNYMPFEHEGTDLYDIIDWISKQEWCNGSVGMYGGSYTGFSQWAAVKNRHPALKTIVPQVAVMPGYDFPMENNVPLPHILGWSNDHIYKHKPLPRSLPFDYFNHGTAFRRMDSLAGVSNPIFQQWLSHPAYDSYWQSMVPTPAEYANIDIPILTTTGYYDDSQIGAMRYFNLHTRYNQNANHYVVIGPYDHWGAQRKAAPNLKGYQIDSVAQLDMMGLAYDWLDFVLKGKARPEILKNKINYQVMGTNEWRHAASLKEVNNDTFTYYLAKTGLTPVKPRKRDFREQYVDLKDRENQNSYYTPSIVFDSLDAGNGLVFATQPFEQAFVINGSCFGNLSVTINKKDIDVSLALYEQQPNGTYHFLTRYVGRASFANDPSNRQLLQPNIQEHIPFRNTRFVSKKVSKGSRLVVVLNINKHPFEIINYGTGKPVSEETILDAQEPLQLKWHNDGFISIPVWKGDAVK